MGTAIARTFILWRSPLLNGERAPHIKPGAQPGRAKKGRRCDKSDIGCPRVTRGLTVLRAAGALGMAQIDVEQALSSARSRPAGTPPLSAVDLQIETAATTRFGSFADPRLEQTYRFEVIAPKLQVGATRAAIVGLVGIFVQLVFRLGNLVPISSPRVWISLLNAALCGAIIMGMRLARYINMNQRIWFEEVVLLLAASLVFILLQLPERLESLLEGTPPLSLCAPTFRFLLAAFLLGIFTPLRPPLYAFLALVGFAAAAIAEMMVGQRDMIGLFWSFGLTCTIVAGRHRIMSIERSQWYFHRSVKEAVVAREIKEREREAQKVSPRGATGHGSRGGELA